MNTALKSALIAEVFSSVQCASVALSEGDVDTATWAIGVAHAASERFTAGQQQEEPPTQRRRRKPRAKSRPRAVSRNGSNRRVPVAKRRAQVMELLHREGKPLTTGEITEKLGTSPEVARRAIGSIDATLLEVAKGKGRQPTTYALASVREEAPA